MKRVPSIKLKIIGIRLLSGKYNINELIIDAIKIGNPVTSQWQSTFAKTNTKEGSFEMKNSSNVPSLKSSLKIVSIASKEDKSAAIQMTPGAKDRKNS
tara:strand:+ start:9286 stop:9579 length:294 start_codon:yes stop_codon:yes gene_type:complete